MTRRRKTGNYTAEDRKMILEAAISESAGKTLGEKQSWLLKKGIHRPGVPNEPVSESAINYWRNAHRKVSTMAQDQYERAMDQLLGSPPSYRALKEQLPGLLSGSVEAQ